MSDQAPVKKAPAPPRPHPCEGCLYGVVSSPVTAICKRAWPHMLVDGLAVDACKYKTVKAPKGKKVLKATRPLPEPAPEEGPQEGTPGEGPQGPQEGTGDEAQ